MTEEIIGLNHDHVALFNMFRGATKSCVKRTINRVIFRIKHPSSNYIITYFTVDNRSRINTLNMVWMPLKIIRISLETEKTERKNEENKDSSTQVERERRKIFGFRILFDVPNELCEFFPYRESLQLIRRNLIIK